MTSAQIHGGYRGKIERVRVAVLGAGLSGICIGIQLRKHQIADFVILEKAKEAGGTWRENTYPGVACDVPSHLYSFSFALNANWQHFYPAGQEIRDYCEDCINRHGLRSHINFNTEVQEVVFDGNEWCIQTTDGKQLRAQIIVSGLGGLHLPRHPDLPGSDSFSGARFHTAKWDHAYDLKGKRVAIIGTGASAVQLLPTIAEDAKEVIVFQRSAAWVLPRMSRKISRWRRRLYRRFPWLMRLHRWRIWLLTDVLGTSALRRGSFMNNRMAQTAHQYLEQSVSDPGLRQQLTPDDLPGCRRRCISDDYLTTFNRDNVHLVTDSIAAVEEQGIRDVTGKLHQVDAIIEATGFRPFNITNYLSVLGRQGRKLQDVWSGQVTSFRTMMVPEFPNFFMLFGPNSGSSHISALTMIESQVGYILKCLDWMEREGIQHLDPDPEVTKAYNERLQKAMKKMTFGGGCNAWYTDAQDRNFTLWPYSARRFIRELSSPNKSEFRLS